MTKPQAARGKLLPDELAGTLARRIQRGELAAGALLPSERDLTGQFGVSRAVVREALAHLKTEGLVTARQGKGAFVADRAQRQSFRLRDVALGEKESQAHVIELLIALESAAARLAAQRRTAAELERIRRALDAVERAIAGEQLGDAEDYAFHQAIIDATHNPHFQALNDHLEYGVRRLIRQARSNTARNLSHLVHEVQREHEAIYRAIAAGDGAAAARAAEEHLRHASRRLSLYLGAASRRRKARA